MNDKLEVKDNHSSCPKEELWSHLPAWVQQQDDGTTKQILATFEEQLELWKKRIDETLHIADPARTPPWALDLLLRTWGFDPSGTLTQGQKRRLVRWVTLLHRRAGTAQGIEQAVRAVTGLSATCLPLNHGWALDSDLLGHTTALAVALIHPQDAYAFDLQIHGPLTQQQRAIVRELVDTLRPVHCPLRSLRDFAFSPESSSDG